MSQGFKFLDLHLCNCFHVCLLVLLSKSTAKKQNPIAELGFHKHHL